MKLSVHIVADLLLPEDTPTTLQIEAAQIAGVQSVEAPVFTVTPFAAAEPFPDFYGNPCRRALLAAGEVWVEYKATVTLPGARFSAAPLGGEIIPYEADALHLPTSTLLYTLPSR